MPPEMVNYCYLSAVVVSSGISTTVVNTCDSCIIWNRCLYACNSHTMLPSCCAAWFCASSMYDMRRCISFQLAFSVTSHGYYSIIFATACPNSTCASDLFKLISLVCCLFAEGSRLNLAEWDIVGFDGCEP